MIDGCLSRIEFLRKHMPLQCDIFKKMQTHPHGAKLLRKHAHPHFLTFLRKKSEGVFFGKMQENAEG